MNSVRGPQFNVFLEELTFTQHISLEMATFRVASYYIALPTGVFSPRVLFVGTIANIVKLETTAPEEEVPIFLRDDREEEDEDASEEEQGTEMRDIQLPSDLTNRQVVNTHVLHLEGLTPESSISVLTPSFTDEFIIGQRVLLSAKVFDPVDSSEFLDIFLRVEKIRFLNEEEYRQELAISLESLNSRVTLFRELSEGLIDYFSERHNYLLNMYNLSERNVELFSYEEITSFRDSLVTNLKILNA